MTDQPVISKVITVTAPGTALFELPFLKDYIKDVPDTDDSILTSLLGSAVANFETGTNQRLITQTCKMQFSCWMTPFKLDAYPVSEITSVKYYDADDVQQTLAVAEYHTQLNLDAAEIHVTGDIPEIYDRPDAIEIEFKVGYGPEASVPGDMKDAILMMITSGYERRENYVSKLPTAASIIMARHRKWGF